jgi:hypothetical protein
MPAMPTEGMREEAQRIKSGKMMAVMAALK